MPTWLQDQITKEQMRDDAAARRNAPPPPVVLPLSGLISHEAWVARFPVAGDWLASMQHDQARRDTSRALKAINGFARAVAA